MGENIEEKLEKESRNFIEQEIDKDLAIRRINDLSDKILNTL